VGQSITFHAKQLAGNLVAQGATLLPVRGTIIVVHCTAWENIGAAKTYSFNPAKHQDFHPVNTIAQQNQSRGGSSDISRRCHDFILVDVGQSSGSRAMAKTSGIGLRGVHARLCARFASFPIRQIVSHWAPLRHHAFGLTVVDDGVNAI